MCPAQSFACSAAVLYMFYLCGCSCFVFVWHLVAKAKLTFLVSMIGQWETWKLALLVALYHESTFLDSRLFRCNHSCFKFEVFGGFFVMTETSLCPGHRHSEHYWLQHLWEVLQEGEIWNQKISNEMKCLSSPLCRSPSTSIYCTLLTLHVQAKVIFDGFFRTTSVCWIWLETSFWLPTWLTTYAFSRTCRKWLMVSSVCTVTSLLLLYAHNFVQQREALFRSVTPKQYFYYYSFNSKRLNP